MCPYESIESIIIDSVMVISVRNNSSSWYAIESAEKKTSESITCVLGRGVVKTLLNCLSKIAHISNLSDVSIFIFLS